MATRYCHEFGMTREHLGMVATGQRAFAQHNPSAVMPAPLTMEDYLGARMISSPLGLFDSDVPIDAACVVIVSAAAAPRDCARTPLTLAEQASALVSQHPRPHR